MLYDNINPFNQYPPETDFNKLVYNLFTHI